MHNTHTETFIVRGTDCDRYRRMRLDALFIAMQEGGERHAFELGAGYDAMMARGLFFVLARIHVKIERMPRCGETVVHTTWPGASNRFFCPRYHIFTLEDGTPLLSVGALWVMLDAVNRKIVSPKNQLAGFPDNSDIPAPIELPVKLPLLKEASLSAVRTPVFSEFDINNHVNNTKYMAWLCDMLGSKLLHNAHINELTAGYEKEIREEAPLNLSLNLDGDNFSFLVTAMDGSKHFIAGGRLTREV